MKTHIYIVLIIFGIIVFTTSPLVYAEMSASMGVRYDTFADDRSPKEDGTELTMPFGVVYKQERLLLRLETAYSRAHVDPGADPDAEISSFTDTLLAGSYMFPDLPVGVVVGLDVNIPTGKARLRERERAAEAGERHDLFEVDNFGEGLNVGLNLGLIKEIGNVNVGLTGVYLFKGKYDPTQDTPDDDLDPGDQTLVMAALKWKAASWCKVETLAAYAHSAPDTTGGKRSFQDGDKVVLNGMLRIQRPAVEIVVGVQNAFQGKNKELADDKFTTESANSNGNELFGWFDFTYRASVKLDLLVLGDIRDYGESDRKVELTGLPYEGHRLRYSIGPGVTYSLNDHFACNVVAKYFLMDQQRDLVLPQDTTVHGMNLSLGLTYTF